MKKFNLVLMVLMSLSTSSYATKYMPGSTSARQDSAAASNQMAREQFEQHQKNKPNLKSADVWNAPVNIDCYDTNKNQWEKCQVQTLKEQR
jgi:type II secretory pathway pseudopilin PulG